MQPANRAKTGQFEKGQSGNPSGRPKMDPEAREMLKANTRKAVETLISLMDHESGKVALMAAQTILDRAWGKPVQASEVQMDVTGTLDLRAEVRAALLERAREKREAAQ